MFLCISYLGEFQATVMEQYAKDRGFSSLRYDQSSTGQSIGLTRKEVGVKKQEI